MGDNHELAGVEISAVLFGAKIKHRFAVYVAPCRRLRCRTVVLEIVAVQYSSGRASSIIRRETGC